MNYKSPDYFMLDDGSGTYISSAKYGLYVDTPPMPPMAERESQTYSYYSGGEQLLYLENRYKDITIDITCILFEEITNPAEIYSFIATGKKLKTSKNANFYYKIKKVAGITPNYSGHGKNVLNVSFTCSPYRYALPNETEIEFDENHIAYINNSNSTIAQPILTIESDVADMVGVDGYNSLICNDYQFYWELLYSQDCTIVIDSYRKIAYGIYASDTSKKYLLKTKGKFPELKVGTNTIEQVAGSYGNTWKIDKMERCL